MPAMENQKVKLIIAPLVRRLSELGLQDPSEFLRTGRDN